LDWRGKSRSGFESREKSEKVFLERGFFSDMG
jgi:hypothetical protein